MSKAVEIEGSAERAADRGRNAFAPLESTKMYLGSRDIVDMLVRQFLGAVVDVRKAYNADTLEATAASARVLEEAKKHAAIFMGKDDRYGTMPWNSPEQLGQYLTRMFKEGGTTPENSAETLFLQLATDFINTVIAPAEAEQLADEDGQFRTDALVEDATLALLGLPPELSEI